MFTEQNVIDYYDEVEVHYKQHWKLDKCLAIHYGYVDKKNRSFQKSLVNMNRILIEKAQISKTDYVLDAGCGVGGSSIFMAKETGCKAVGITLANKQVESAKKYAIKRGVSDLVDFDAQSYLNTNFEDNTFDVIWALESVCHSPDKADFYKEARRILKPGGRLIVADYYRKENLHNDGDTLIKQWLHCWAIENISTLEDTKSYLEDFRESNIEDITKNIRPSSKYMYNMHYLGLIFHRAYDLIYGVSKESEANFQSAKYQYQALKKNYWTYNIITAVK
jgi:tocopherol O-methyltransferase